MNPYVCGVPLNDDERAKFLEIMKVAFPEFFDEELQIVGSDTISAVDNLIFELRQ